MEHLIWKEVNRQKIFSTNVFDLYSTTRMTPEGQTNTFTIIHPPDWANVVPLVKDSAGRDCFLMIHQYRQGSESVTLEFPGGVLEPGEDPRSGAMRELLEETGYSAGKFRFAGKINPNPAIMDNWCHTFIAEELQKTHDLDLDEHEYVEVELVPVERVERELGEGPFLNAIIVTAYMWYRKWKTGKA